MITGMIKRKMKDYDKCIYCDCINACDLCEMTDEELLFYADHEKFGPAEHWTFLDFIKESLPSFLYRFRDYLSRLTKSGESKC